MATSASAKERLFQKKRQFTLEQREWIDAWKSLAARGPRDRLSMEAFRGVLIHLKVSRDELLELSKKLHTAQQELDEEQTAAELTKLMVSSSVFPGDDALRRTVRVFAQRLGASRRQLLKPPR